ncbi:RloB family protein [Paracholeplasma manati]|uniref:RloB family protein n=1 Tax=Paracholeplasma manati TaxID=591373 RepID=UPI002407BA34|nr:RloB family protein [Paracholeplasma manati]MDG0888939.1 RloB family protein [Paracholeplasma manati]
MINLSQERKISHKKQFLGKVIIFCEGATEFNYFNYFKVKLDSKKNKYINLEIEPVDVAGGGAISIFNKVITFLENPDNHKYQYHEKVIVFDLDDPIKQELMIKLLVEMSKSDYGFTLLYSYKSFEVWLLMHLMEVSLPMTKRQLNERIREQLNMARYVKSSKGMISKILHDESNVINAIQNAEKLEKKYREDSLKIISSYKEMNPFTNVHKLVEEILENL